MVIVIQCKDRVGLVAEISAVLAKYQINIVSMREFVDTLDGEFFARLVVVPHPEVNNIQETLQAVLPTHARVKVNPNPDKKLAILVTKEYHCLSDILVRNHFKTLGAEVQVVIGNHANLEDICKRFEIPFYYIPYKELAKEKYEQAIQDVLNLYDFDYLVLAKFMRILSEKFVAQYPNQIINIHHSFLPAFVGASPYRQAFERGVKLIGATAHFVTNELDEGPIISQQIIPVNHTFSVEDMVGAGKEIEKSVLSKAISLVIQDRVFVFKHKTVVFD
jgi:formyltetrahydrofolate deformylase